MFPPNNITRCLHGHVAPACGINGTENHSYVRLFFALWNEILASPLSCRAGVVRTHDRRTCSGWVAVRRLIRAGRGRAANNSAAASSPRI
jgi:hypothetical protein